MNATNDLCEHARRVAEKLLRDLSDTKEKTNGWSDQARSNIEVARIMNSCLDELSSTECWGEANRLPSSALWQVVGDVLSVGWLQQHARQKPRGYAGDFEMLEKIVARTLCSDPLGRAFDHFFQEQSAPNAVRARTQLVADRIVQFTRASTREKVHVCSVGAGPAIDVELACRELSDTERARLVVTLLDIDPKALVQAMRRLAPLVAGDQLRLHRENLFRLPRLSRTSTLLQQADFISCTGLFDYLTDADAVALLHCFWNQLANRGEMIVFNFAPSNPSQAYMEWIGNWYLTYRDETMLADLVRQAIGQVHQSEIAREDSKASLYAVCRKS